MSEVGKSFEKLTSATESFAERLKATSDKVSSTAARSIFDTSWMDRARELEAKQKAQPFKTNALLEEILNELKAIRQHLEGQEANHE